MKATISKHGQLAPLSYIASLGVPTFTCLVTATTINLTTTDPLSASARVSSCQLGIYIPESLNTQFDIF